MLPAGLLAQALHLCAAGVSPLVVAGPATENLYVISIDAGPALLRQPDNQADAEATVQDLLRRGADFKAGPLAIRGSEFAKYGITPRSIFDPCALGHMGDDDASPTTGGGASLSEVTALVRRAFGARITDTLRPMNASYGALHSWHKVGQAVDFVPASGVMAINRPQIRALMAANGIHLLELLGPGDPGHSNHWHIAFARPGQIVDRPHVEEGDEDWIVEPPSAGPLPTPVIAMANASTSPAPLPHLAAKAPPAWDVFASAQWRNSRGNGS